MHQRSNLIYMYTFSDHSGTKIDRNTYTYTFIRVNNNGMNSILRDYHTINCIHVPWQKCELQTSFCLLEQSAISPLLTSSTKHTKGYNGKSGINLSEKVKLTLKPLKLLRFFFLILYPYVTAICNVRHDRALMRYVHTHIRRYEDAIVLSTSVSEETKRLRRSPR